MIRNMGHRLRMVMRRVPSRGETSSSKLTIC
jgi:hypothetical protein